MENAGAFAFAGVLADAARKESLTEWGPGDFEHPLSVLLADYEAADLNAIGTHILRSGIVHSLRMRLRAQEWMCRHPEILDERMDDAFEKLNNGVIPAVFIYTPDGKAGLGASSESSSASIRLSRTGMTASSLKIGTTSE